MLQFALLGLGAGAIYALLGQGLVLIFRGSGILNLAHGVFAMFGAFFFYELHSLHGNGTLVSLIITVLATGMVGVATDQLLLRRLRGASGLTRLIGTLGVFIVVVAIADLRYGPQPRFIDPVIKQRPVHVLGATVASDRLWLLAIAVALTCGLTLASRFTRIGWAMSAVAENQRSAAALGWSPERISALTWGLGAGLAGLAGVLIAPIAGLGVSNLAMLVIPALAAALVGGFSSFPFTLLGGLALGIAEAETTRYVDLTGAATSVPLLIIVLVLAFRGSSLPMRGYITDRLPLVGDGRIQVKTVAAVVGAAAVLIVFVLDGGWLDATIVALSVAIILLSLVVLTGYSGQLSLAQFALAGVGALVAARLVEAGGLPFPLALVLGVLGAVGFGLVFALPALRTRGVELAVVTLALGAAVQATLFNNADVIGTSAGTNVGSPSLFGLDLDAYAHPQRYALLVLVLFGAAALAVANLRRGRSGRRLLAVRANERAAAAMGISVFGAKLHAFALAGAFAGLGGILLAFRAPTVVYGGFGPMDSLVGVAQAVIGGIGFVLGPLVGAQLASGSIPEHVLDLDPEAAGEYLPAIAGLMLLATLVQAPNGIVRMVSATSRRLSGHSRRRSTTPALDLPRPHSDRVRVSPRRLVVENLGVRYGGVIAVTGVSLAVEPGSIVGLIGPNGAGKTSVIDAASGFTRSSGAVTIENLDVSAWSPARRARAGLARSFQSLELFEEMTVLENLQTAGESRDVLAMITDLVRPGTRGLTPMAAAAVHAFELEEVLDRRPPELSYGQRRLVAIARAVAAEPSILLLDEPAAGLDEDESKELAALVRRMADDWGIGVLVIEHDMEFVMGICDHVLVIDFGKPIASGTAAEVRADPAAIAAYLGDEAAVEEEAFDGEDTVKTAEVSP